MKHLAVAALVFAGITLPVCAQRGGGGSHGGGFAGHSTGAMRSAPMSSGARGFSGSPGFTGNRITSANRSGIYGGSALHRGYSNGNRFRRPYGGGYGVGIPYIIPIWGSWADPGALGYGDTSGYDPNGYVDPNANAYADPNAYSDPGAGAAYPAYPDGYAPGQPDPSQRMPPGPYSAPYQPLPQPAATISQQPLRDEEPVTLVFRDGRPTQQIHNYALTRTTLVVMDGRRREIPLAQLDIPETERINREAGVEFTTLGANR